MFIYSIQIHLIHLIHLIGLIYPIYLIYLIHLIGLIDPIDPVNLIDLSSPSSISNLSNLSSIYNLPACCQLSQKPSLPVGCPGGRCWTFPNTPVHWQHWQHWQPFQESAERKDIDAMRIDATRIPMVKPSSIPAFLLPKETICLEPRVFGKTPIWSRILEKVWLRVCCPTSAPMFWSLITFEGNNSPGVSDIIPSYSFYHHPTKSSASWYTFNSRMALFRLL